MGVIGDPVSHSMSPLLHNAAFDALGLDWVSVAFAVRAGAAADALTGMRALGLAGLSVTMPHKQDAFRCVDTASDVARRLGAVNCVTLRDGELLGDSTDGEGFLTALRRAVGFEPSGRRCLVIGAGGAARAVVLALSEAGASDVAVVNRTASRAEAAAALAGRVGRVGTHADVADAELVVQATPVGMAARAGADGDALPVDPGALHPGQVVADLVYLPAETPILREAAARGATPVGGLGMLVHQAALALELWTGRAVPVDAMWSVAEARLSGDDSGLGEGFVRPRRPSAPRGASPVERPVRDP
ncbi:MAG TPA: shikimate dehydrogenase [Acidimicrobiales bacterium]|nr:shikimate dehydrogenase [Acidimicrobiales bacterium]